MDRRAWEATVHGVTKSQIQLKWLSTYVPVSPSLQAAAAAAKSLQSCPTLCDSTDGSPPGSPVPGILQARTLEWVATSFSNAWKWRVKVKSLSRVWLLATPWTAAHQAPPSMGFSRQEAVWGAFIHIWKPEIADGCDISWLLIWQSFTDWTPKNTQINPSQMDHNFACLLYYHFTS